MKQIIMLTMLALGMICINGSAQTKKLVRRTATQVRKNTSTSKPVQKDSREYKVEDGFEWYLVCKNGKYGAEDRSGNILVPTEYTKVSYSMQGNLKYFHVTIGEYDGIYDLTGKCLIPHSRQYHIGWILEETEEGLGTYYRLCKGRFVGNSYITLCEVICDSKWKEIINMKDVNIWPKYDLQERSFYFYFIKDNNHGIADSKGHLIINPTPMEDGEWIYYDGKEGYFFCNKKNKKKILAYVSSEKLKDNPFKDNFTESSNSSAHSPSSSNSNSGNSTTTVVIEQHGPVQVWVPCGGCQFEPGRCTYCHGSGWGYNNRLCTRCGGNGKCTICGGTGGQNEVQYR